MKPVALAVSILMAAATGAAAATAPPSTPGWG
jgi:hypothetical protein